MIDRYLRLAPHLADDIAGEAALARVEAERAGLDPAPLVEARLRALLASDRRQHHGEHFDGAVSGSAIPAAQAEKPRPLTPGQRWRKRRDIVICIAHRSGVPQRWLAEVFDLPRSRIGAIVKALNERTRP